MIPYGKQTIDDDDIAAVVDVLRSSHLTQGPAIDTFERAVADYCGAKHAISFANGTAALHAACLATDIGPNDCALVPPISFAATANCLAYVGATPQFVDITPGLPLLDPAALPELPPDRCRAILPVHFAGSVCDMAAIHAYAQQHNLVVIEDACHALGAKYTTDKNHWHTVGDCTHSTLCVFSFHPVKSITTGEGGLITTNRDDLAARLRIIRQHGIIRPSGPDIPAWRNDMITLGYNFRLTDMQAALGTTQLAKLDRFIGARVTRFSRYQQAFAGNPHAQLLLPPATSRTAHHLAILLLRDATRRDALLARLREHHIGAQLHYLPIYRHPYYVEWLGDVSARYPHAEHYWQRALSIPLFPTLTIEEQDHVIATITRELAA